MKIRLASDTMNLTSRFALSPASRASASPHGAELGHHARARLLAATEAAPGAVGIAATLVMIAGGQFHDGKAGLQQVHQEHAVNILTAAHRHGAFYEILVPRR